MFDPSTHILVIEDSEVMGNMLLKEFGAVGFKNVELLLDSSKALEKLREMVKASGGQESTKCLAVVDWYMPGTSGMEILKQVRADAELAKLPFLMVTTEAQKQNVVLAHKAGTSGYLMKPFSREQLQAAIQSVWKRCGDGKAQNLAA